MSSPPSVYFDYNASAPLCAEAAAAMAPWLSGSVSNPSSAHRSGQRARAAVEGARAQVASLLGCDPVAVVFTSGGTEADNTAIFGAMGWPPQGHLVISAIEHPAVLEPAVALHELGLEVTRVAVGTDGRVDPEVKAPKKGKVVSRVEYNKIVKEKMDEMRDNFRGGNRRSRGNFRG